MPSASELRGEAVRIRTIIASLTNMWGVMERQREATGLQGGRFATAIDVAYAAGIANASELAGRCDAVVDELHRRAALCDQFTDDMAAYDRRLAQWRGGSAEFYAGLQNDNPIPWLGAEPTPPPPPFPGAVAG